MRGEKEKRHNVTDTHLLFQVLPLPTPLPIAHFFLSAICIFSSLSHTHTHIRTYLLLAHIQQLVQLHAAVSELAECALLLLLIGHLWGEGKIVNEEKKKESPVNSLRERKRDTHTYSREKKEALRRK